MNRGLLQAIVNGREPCSSVIIEDSVKCNGRYLLKSFVSSLAKKYASVQVWLHDLPEEAWLAGLSPAVKSRIRVISTLNDPLKWDERSGDGDLAIPTLMDSLPSLLPPEKEEGSNDVALVVDSLSTILLYHGYVEVCQFLHALGQQVAVLCSLLHWDLHDDHVIGALGHVTSSLLRVSPALPSGGAVEEKGECKVLLKKKSGKVISKREFYHIGEDYVLKSWDIPQDVADALDKSADPTVNLTFDLRLSEREKVERSKVVLPYTQQVGTTLPSGKTSVARGGQVVYELDEADDFDDSDPDNDLDI